MIVHPIYTIFPKILQYYNCFTQFNDAMIDRLKKQSIFTDDSTILKSYCSIFREEVSKMLTLTEQMANNNSSWFVPNAAAALGATKPFNIMEIAYIYHYLYLYIIEQKGMKLFHKLI